MIMSTVVESTSTGPETEVRPRRRTYTAKYKLGILAEVDTARGEGAVGEILRREGLYSSLITQWRHQREQAALEVMPGRRRGRKAKSTEAVEVDRLRDRVAELEAQLVTAEELISAQGKTLGLLQQMRRKSPEQQ